jgi:hypothetical protein
MYNLSTCIYVPYYKMDCILLANKTYSRYQSYNTHSYNFNICDSNFRILNVEYHEEQWAVVMQPWSTPVMFLHLQPLFLLHGTFVSPPCMYVHSLFPPIFFIIFFWIHFTIRKFFVNACVWSTLEHFEITIKYNHTVQTTKHAYTRCCQRSFPVKCIIKYALILHLWRWPC